MIALYKSKGITEDGSGIKVSTRVWICSFDRSWKCTPPTVDDVQSFNTRRKVKDIEYPSLYHPGKEKLNCVVRAHQNILEGYPVFLMVLFVGGLQRPKICASAGWVWILGQVAYVYCYCSDDKTNRRYGKCIGYLGLLTMFGCTIEFGVRELMHKRILRTAIGVKNVVATKAKGLLPTVMKKQNG